LGSPFRLGRKVYSAAAGLGSDFDFDLDLGFRFALVNAKREVRVVFQRAFGPAPRVLLGRTDERA
jgi:hypothetical protein